MSETRNLCNKCLPSGVYLTALPINDVCDLCGRKVNWAGYSSIVEVELNDLPPEILIKILSRESARELVRQQCQSFVDWLDRQQCLP